MIYTSKIDDYQKEVLKKLDIIIKLFGTRLCSDIKTNKDKILFLNNIGFKPNEIINITEIPPKTVYNVLSGSRKSDKKPEKPESVNNE